MLPMVLKCDGDVVAPERTCPTCLGGVGCVQEMDGPTVNVICYCLVRLVNTATFTHYCSQMCVCDVD